MNRRSIVLLGILSFTPLIYGIFFSILLLSGIALLSADFLSIENLLPLHIAMIANYVGVLIFYVWSLTGSDAFAPKIKIAWICSFFYAGVFVFPAFWLIYLQPTKK